MNTQPTQNTPLSHQQDELPAPMSPEQARAALAEARLNLPDADRDRRIHALATAGFGALVGVYVALTQALPDDSSARGFMTAGYVGLLIGLALWQTRGARTVPRHSKVTSWIGLAGTFVMMMASTITLNLLETRSGQVTSLSPLWYVLAAVVVAVPMLVAGGLIAKRRA